MAARTEHADFNGATGARLAGRLERPSDRPVAYAIFAHCFTCSKDYKAVRRISRTLAEEGIAVLRFDFTGLGESGGNFSETTFSSNVGDVVAAADWLRRQHEAPGLLIGHSLGGAAVLTAASQIPEVKAVATLAAPSDTQHLRQILVAQSPEIVSAGEGVVEIGGRTLRVRKELLDDLDAQRLDETIATLGRPLMIFHSPADETVDIDEARKVFEMAGHPKSFVSLGEADHLLVSDPRDAPFVGRVLAAWAKRYLE